MPRKRNGTTADLRGSPSALNPFLYVPPGVKVGLPLKSYFRINEPGCGQFGRTLIILGAEVKWLDCNIGSKLPMKYPSTILKGEKARAAIL